MLEIFVLMIRENRRGKGTKPFAMLDARVENVLHVRQTGMGEDGAVATEGARTPLHAALEPADDISRGRDLVGDGLQ